MRRVAARQHTRLTCRPGPGAGSWARCVRGPTLESTGSPSSPRAACSHPGDWHPAALQGPAAGRGHPVGDGHLLHHLCPRQQHHPDADEGGGLGGPGATPAAGRWQVPVAGRQARRASSALLNGCVLGSYPHPVARRGSHPGAANAQRAASMTAPVRAPCLATLCFPFPLRRAAILLKRRLERCWAPAPCAPWYPSSSPSCPTASSSACSPPSCAA